jgi:UDP-N-acetylmuramoyl-L-alanyl-D-glutamate--2,6-diaminopimelate ligase
VWLGGDGREVPEPNRPLTIVKSPGIGFDVPLLDPRRVRDAEVIDELEFGWRRCRRPVAAVTGTNGKSTTSALIAAVLSAAGHRVALAGNTEFGPPLSAAPDCDWIVCEVSSFQLEGAPTFRPRLAVFTNLSPEHLDRHGSMARYGAAKRRMFVGPSGTAGSSVVNIDDACGRDIARAVASAGGELTTYGSSDAADVRIQSADWDLETARLRLCTPAGAIGLETRLPGLHNAHNVAAAIATAVRLDVLCDDVLRAVESAEAPPGRWQVIDHEHPFTVLVDYAHTPDGLAQVLGAVRKVVARQGTGRVFTVFGAVGLPDENKACASARVLSELSDELVLSTGSAPRSARVARLAELARAADRGARERIVLDRAAAIEQAISEARAGDVVAVLGLGALDRLTLDANGAVTPHRDADAARSALGRRTELASCA